jgi:Spy/CpxP family protein refolding chaperone
MHSKRIGSFKAAAAVAVALGLLAVPGLALAQPGHGPHDGRGPGGHHGPMLQRLLERLDLSDAQKESVHNLIGKHHEETQGLIDDVRIARRALGDTIHAETFDEAAIRQAAADVATIEAELSVNRGLFFQQVQQILTPEQREQLRQTLQDWHAMRDEMRSERRGWRYRDTGDDD